MELYLGVLTDGEHFDHRLVGAHRESMATSFFELQAARLSRLVQRTWWLQSLARVESVPLADDPEGSVDVRLDIPG